MARSKQSSQKGEREKKKKRNLQEKEEKKALRKANSNKGKGFDSMIAYMDHNGQLTDTPPDPKLKVEIKAEDIQLGPQTILREAVSDLRTGRIAIYNADRRFGFIKDGITQEKIFFHISQASYEVKEGDSVSYEISHGLKGTVATNVTKNI
jgi:cold shock CspA family protein